MRTIGEILDKIKTLKGIKTDTAMADAFKVKPNTVSNWRKRNSIPLDTLVTYCENEGINIGWLIAGQLAAKYVEVDGKMVLTVTEEPGLYKREYSVIGERLDGFDYEGRIPGGSEFVFVPRLAGRISAGGGLIPDNAVDIRIAFRREWVEKKGDPEKMSLIKVSGDSMEPTLLAGDLVLVDHGRKTLDPQGGIYAIAVDDAIMIKRLQINFPDENVQIISDNPKYKVMEANIDQLCINGKVIWFGRELER